MKVIEKYSTLAYKEFAAADFPVTEKTISEKIFYNKTIYTSDFIRIIDFQCDSNESFTSNLELSGYFSIGFTRTGNFHFHSYRHSADIYNSRILIEKPECEYRLTHNGEVSNATTFFIFAEEFYEALKEKYNLKRSVFFNNSNILSLLLLATPEMEYLHFSIWQKIKKKENSKLEIDSMAIELLHLVIETLTCETVCNEMPENIKKNHLTTIERAKEYILKNFTRNISLNELAKYCHVSPFHFSRIFKQFSSFSPYQYLQNFRLKNAEMLLKTTSLSITDVCYMSGFNSLDYFSSTFSKKYNLPPSKYRTSLV